MRQPSGLHPEGGLRRIFWLEVDTHEGHLLDKVAVYLFLVALGTGAELPQSQFVNIARGEVTASALNPKIQEHATVLFFLCKIRIKLFPSFAKQLSWTCLTLGEHLVGEVNQRYP